MDGQDALLPGGGVETAKVSNNDTNQAVGEVESDSQVILQGDATRTGRWLRLIRFIPSTKSSSLIRTPDRAESNLEIEVELFKYDAHEAPPYNALSYTWGDANQEMKTILLSGREFPVSTGLFEALKVIQLLLDREWQRQLEAGEAKESSFLQDWIWIDQLCINQQDLVEKNEQVQAMLETYRGAHSVFAWLGPESETSKAGLEFAYDLSDCYSYDDGDARAFTRLQNSVNLLSELTALAEILDRPYWKRKWIVQEYAATSNVEIWCGDYKMVTQRLWVAQNLVSGQYSRDCFRLIVQRLLTITDQSARTRIEHALFQWGPRSLHQTQEAISSANFGYADGWMVWLMASHRWKRSSEAKDMVYSFVNLFPFSSEEYKYPIMIDYRKSARTVFIDFMHTCIRTHSNLNVWRYLPGLSPFVEDLPSWVVDWTAQDVNHLVIRESTRADRPSTPGGDPDAAWKLLEISAGGDWLRVNGVQIGTIDELSPKILKSRNGSDEETIRELHGWLHLFAKTDQENEQKLESLGFAVGAGIRALGNDYDADTSRADARNLCADLVRKSREHFPEVPLDFLPDGFLVEYGNKEPASQDVETPKLSMWDSRAAYSNKYKMAGKIPAAAEIGDILCVLFGCPLVMVVRQHDTGFYRMIGTSWFGRFMHGEAVNMVLEQKLQVEVFPFL